MSSVCNMSAISAAIFPVVPGGNINDSNRAW